jgi:uncharacterized protein YdeI (YjbR/CyaY-like superfamily)
MDNVPHFYAKDRATWRKWLETHHATETAVWLVYDKGTNRSLTWPDIVQEALCFGWIDSRPGKVSETQSKIYVTRRKPKSVWSKINKAHVDVLIEKQLMRPAGQLAIEVAQQNGSWDALNLSDDLIYPPELIAALNDAPIAKQNFESFPTSSRRNMLQWIYDARTESTRMARVDQIVVSAGQNIRLR